VKELALTARDILNCGQKWLAPQDRRDKFLDPYFRKAKPNPVVAIIKAALQQVGIHVLLSPLHSPHMPECDVVSPLIHDLLVGIRRGLDQRCN
jgi:hypothetical protein